MVDDGVDQTTAAAAAQATDSNAPRLVAVRRAAPSTATRRARGAAAAAPRGAPVVLPGSPEARRRSGLAASGTAASPSALDDEPELAVSSRRAIPSPPVLSASGTDTPGASGPARPPSRQALAARGSVGGKSSRPWPACGKTRTVHFLARVRVRCSSRPTIAVTTMSSPKISTQTESLMWQGRTSDRARPCLGRSLTAEVLEDEHADQGRVQTPQRRQVVGSHERGRDRAD
jgi:hypothetical protein